MKKLKLKADYSFDFHLIGIISKSKEYAVSWGINQVLGIGLKKELDLVIEMKNQETLVVSNYIFENDVFRFSLIPNLVVTQNSKTQKNFVPSLGTFDYLLKIEEFEEASDLNSIFSKLRNAPKVDSIVKLDVSKIKEKESFLF
ncbi:MAG: IPExxxVDY family protein [Reichenbachiella sp.]